MPCDSIITQSVSLESITSPELLKNALESLGVRRLKMAGLSAYFDFEGIDYAIEGGKLRGSGSYLQASDVGQFADQVKQAYSKAAIYAAARKHNWLVKETSKNKFEISRRF